MRADSPCICYTNYIQCLWEKSWLPLIVSSILHPDINDRWTQTNGKQRFIFLERWLAKSRHIEILISVSYLVIVYTEKPVCQLFVQMVSKIPNVNSVRINHLQIIYRHSTSLNLPREPGTGSTWSQFQDLQMIFLCGNFGLPFKMSCLFGKFSGRSSQNCLT